MTEGFTQGLAHDLACIEGVKALAMAQELPEAVRKNCDELAQRFDAPLAIGIFGLSGVGKTDVLHALLGEDVVRCDSDVPTMEVLPGLYPSTIAMLADGATVETADYPDAEMLALEPMFLSVTSPACLRLRQSFLVAVCDDTVEDMSAGLAWAAPRIDLAIWCSKQWTRVERAVFARAPEHLKDHAIFCLASPFPVEVAAPDGFDSAFHLDTTQGVANACAALTAHVRRVIDGARTADLLAAEALLHRYQEALAAQPGWDLQSDWEDVPEATAIDALPPTAHATIGADDPWGQHEDGRSDSEPDEEAISQLTLLFRHVRGSAQKLRNSDHDLADPFSGLEQVFEELADRVMHLHAVGDTWPEIEEAVSDAHDLCVLLKLEGGEDKIEDAAHLLLQLRWDMEAKLAA